MDIGIAFVSEPGVVISMMKKIFFVFLFCAGAFIKPNADPLLFSEKTGIQKFDTLTILISEANRIYYYKNELEPDASNFNAWFSYLTKMKELITRFQNESKVKGKELMIIVKVQKTSALNSGTKAIFEHLKKQPHYKLAAMKEVDKVLIKAVEDAIK